MEDQLISLETAKLARDRGFNWPCQNVINDVGHVLNFQDVQEHPFTLEDTEQEGDYLCPTQSLLQKWLRDVHHFNNLNIRYIGNQQWQTDDYFEGKSYEEALEHSLQRSLRMVAPRLIAGLKKQ